MNEQTDNNHFVNLPREVARQINSLNYYPLKPCKRGHTSGRLTKQGSCKTCNKQSERKYARNNQLATWFKCKRNNAKFQGIPFEITLDDVTPIPSVCPILGIPLRMYQGTGKGKGSFRDSASIDRLDPSKGYVKGNVQVISARANTLKNDMTLLELKKLVDYLERHN